MLKNKVMTTGIGSLPHINIDSALAYSFRHDLAFLPQLPKYNPNEFMLYQGLSKLPGIEKPVAGVTLFNLKKWLKERSKFHELTQKAISNNDYSDFIPDSNSYSCLNGFLFELAEREAVSAKIQIIGPFTAIQSLRLSDNSPIFEYKDVIDDITLCLLMSAKALIQKTKDYVQEVVFFIDEPALFMFSPKNANMLESYKAFIHLCNELTQINKLHLGLHSCHNMNWTPLLKEGFFKYISFDLQSPGDLLKNNFTEKNIQFCIGSVSTELSGKEDFASMLPYVLDDLPIKEIMKSTQALLVSAACGLAYREIEDTEAILSALNIEKNFLLNL